MDAVSLAIALKAAGKTAEQVKAALDEYLEENPEALDQAAVEAILDGRLDVIDNELSSVKSALTDMTTATAADEGKALKAKTVADGKVTEWEFGEAGGGSSKTLLGEVVVPGTFITMEMTAIDYATGIITVDDASGLSDTDIGQYSGRVHILRKDMLAKLNTLPAELNTKTYLGIHKVSSTEIQFIGSNIIASYTDSATIDVTKWQIIVLNTPVVNRIQITGLDVTGHILVEAYTPTTNPNEMISIKVYDANDNDIFAYGADNKLIGFFGGDLYNLLSMQSLPVTNGVKQISIPGCGYPVWAYIDITPNEDYIKYSWELDWALCGTVNDNCGYTNDIQTVLSTNEGISKFSMNIAGGYDAFIPGAYLRIWEVND